MVKVKEAIFKKKNEFGPEFVEFALNGRAAKLKAERESAEQEKAAIAEVSNKSKGKRKAADEVDEAVEDKLLAKKKGRKAAADASEVKPVEKKRKVEKKDDNRDTSKPNTRSATKKDHKASSATSTRTSSKAAEPKRQPKSISNTTKALPKSDVSSKTKKMQKAVKAPIPSPSPSQSENEDDAEEEEAQGEENEEFFGLSTDDDGDSSDEDDDVDDAPALDVGKLPTIAKDDATVKRKLDQAKKKPTEERGVIYLGRIPHGFYEDQMKAYFSQFGDVTRLRLSRNKRTGRSKHYAFIEFESSAVAKIVAETMDNYLLMGHILQCKVVPKDEVHPELWIGANRKWRRVPTSRVARVNHNKLRTEDEQSKAENRLIKRQTAKKRKLADAGIDYDIDAVSYKRQSKGSKS